MEEVQQMEWDRMCYIPTIEERKFSRWNGIEYATFPPLKKARCLRRSFSPLHSELLALIWAMESLMAAGVDCKNYETDCAELIAIVQSLEEWPAFSNILDDFSLLRSSFPSFTLTKIPRSSNERADCLARSSRTLVSELSFVNFYPPAWVTNLGVIF
ncbi:PREDICTED: uncharacterized protein LOC104745742 [Camelina sativa]|uniref:Uncharacterized protein LOC104745742 n=1 Tax=Camelina sativa TaxID=90675 RepID=A0ABM0W400_CAMSA|nr:PREDICTED: uncharacterized protein LOC104745742 [Camelina sativa]